MSMNMKIEDLENTIIQGDTLTELRKMPDEFVDMIITSPPYFQQRDYKIDGQIGLEKTYQEYLKKLCDIFNEVKRVLKKEGTCFVNLADKYGGSGMGMSYAGQTCGKNSILKGKLKKFPKIGHNRKEMNKSLMLIPERFAIEMLNQNWILRNKLIWIKRNAMPESVQDRWKRAHEYIFFFVKNKKYYFDLDSIRTPHKDISIKRAEYEQGRNALRQNSSSVGEKYNRDKKNKDGTEKYFSMPARIVKLNPKGACPPDFLDINTNCKTDNTIEHYATYPQDLIFPLIKAGCPPGGIILDPFMGSGTTALMAKKLGRHYIGVELNKNYCDIAQKRINSIQPQSKLKLTNQNNESYE